MNKEKFDEGQKLIDKAISLSEQKLLKMHELKLSLFREYLVSSHDNEFWIDKIPKKEAKELFDKFLVMWKNAFGEPFDNYDRRTREYHFENFKARMIWDYRQNKERLSKK